MIGRELGARFEQGHPRSSALGRGDAESITKDRVDAEACAGMIHR